MTTTPERTTTPIDGDTNKARQQARTLAALDAYSEGKTWEEAAKVAGFAGKGSAYRAVMNYLGRTLADTASKMREEAATRHASKIAMLEDVIYNLDTPLMERLRAVAEHTRAEARHARLHGLDAPVQVQLSAGIAADLEDALRELEESVVPGEVTEVHDDTSPEA